MNIGQMDRRITLQRATMTRASNGEQLSAWEDVATVYAEKKYAYGSENYDADQKQAIQQVKFRLRYRADVVPQLRLLDLSDNYLYQVDAVAEIGRKQGLLLSCFTRGDEARTTTSSDG